jgi:hypothetical protein
MTLEMGNLKQLKWNMPRIDHLELKVPVVLCFVWGLSIHAFAADTREVLWCNDTSGAQFRERPHLKSFAISGVAPQGYLTVSKKRLIVPTGRGLPGIFDRRTGR